nr:hypothetical protein GCM10017611_79720 [Rhodococcus wratislaviensis]
MRDDTHGLDSPGSGAHRGLESDWQVGLTVELREETAGNGDKAFGGRPYGTCASDDVGGSHEKSVHDRPIGFERQRDSTGGI